MVLVGVSRTSKTPTSIYLANRGIRTANVPLVPGIPLPHQLETLKKPLVVSLHATPERLIQQAALLLQAQLGYDRVMVYELGPDGAGKVVAEAITEFGIDPEKRNPLDC